MAPSMVVLLNTPLILLPMRLIPKVSPRLDVLLQATHALYYTKHNERDEHGFSKAHAARRKAKREHHFTVTSQQNTLVVH